MRRILLPYDFSPFSRRALALALSGVPFGPEVQIEALHVVDEKLYQRVQPGRAAPSPAEIAAYFRTEVTRATTPERCVKEDPTIKVVTGRPSHEILSRVGECGGIIMGGQGHGGWSEKFVGTTAMRVAREAPVSVYICKRLLSLAVPMRILCAVDYDDCSRRALKAARALSQQCDAQLSMTRSIQQQPLYIEWTSMPSYPEAEVINIERERLISFEIDTLKESVAQRHDIHFSVGGIAKDIANRAILDRTDCIVVGSHEKGVQKMLLGSVSESVIDQAPCDVYVVRA